MFEKIDVNGPGRHPIYDELTAVADAEGHAGDIRWNFEKFLVDPRAASPGSARWSRPDDPALVARDRGALPELTGAAPVDSPRLMSKKTKKRKARLRRSKANHGKRPNMGRG